MDPAQLTLQNHDSDAIVKISNEPLHVNAMNLLLGQKPRRIVMDLGIMWISSSDAALPFNRAATALLEGEGHDENIFGNAVVIARNGLHSLEKSVL